LCDLRGPPSHLKINNNLIELDYCGNGNEYRYYNQIPTNVGIYHIGASGCGYEYYDGNNWISTWNPPEGYEFIYDKKHKMLTDILWSWDQKDIQWKPENQSN